MRKGFTLAEVLIVFVILAAVAGIALPNFNVSVERAKARQAIACLRDILGAQKLYHARWGKYALANSAAEIQTKLNIEAFAPGYAFAVRTGATGSEADSFFADASRAGKNITIDQNGGFSGGSPYVP